MCFRVDQDKLIRPQEPEQERLVLTRLDSHEPVENCRGVSVGPVGLGQGNNRLQGDLVAGLAAKAANPGRRVDARQDQPGSGADEPVGVTQNRPESLDRRLDPARIRASQARRRTSGSWSLSPPITVSAESRSSAIPSARIAWARRMGSSSFAIVSKQLRFRSGSMFDQQVNRRIRS